MAASDATQALGATILDNSEIAIIGVDLNGDISHWNPGAAEMFGFCAEEVIGKPYANQLPEDRVGEFRKIYGKVKHGRHVPSFDTVRKHKDGALIDTHLSVHPVTDGAGNSLGICTIAVDISKLKRAERAQRLSKAQVEAVVHTVLDGIVTINAKGIIDSVNPAVERIFGYHAHEMIGCNVKMLMPEPYHSEHDGYLDNYTRTGDAKIIGIGREVQGKRKDGVVFPIDLAVSEMIVDGRPAFVGIMRDITERKAAEQALKKLNQKHQAKVEELAATLDQLRSTQDQLVQSEKLASLGGLVAGVAHEINTPIGVCVTAASFLEDRTREFIKARAAPDGLTVAALDQYVASATEASQMIMTNLQRAAQLVASFKQVAVDRSSSELRTFDLKPFLDDVITSLHPLLKKKGHELSLTCEGDLQLQTFPGAFSQIITNFITNILQHAFAEGEKGHITIHSVVTEDAVQLTIQDDGRGIPEENLKKIFDPFFTTARNQGGTGLGLHVVHNLMTEVLGGKVRVESTVGEGTCFYLDMPRVKDPDVQALQH